MAERKRRRSAEYTVGYGKPPIDTRFKPGQSGNPKGRPKGTRNLKTDLQSELGGTITVTENGQRRRISRQEAILRRHSLKAMEGDHKAALLLFNMIIRLSGDEDVAPIDPDAITAEDARLIERLEQRIRRRMTAKDPAMKKEPKR